MFFGVAPASLSGRKPPLIPPYQGGKKLSPFGVALLPYREETPLDPPLSGGQKLSPFGRVRPEGGEVCCRCPPDKGDTPEGGRGFVCDVIPLLPCREENPP